MIEGDSRKRTSRARSRRLVRGRPAPRRCVRTTGARDPGAALEHFGHEASRHRRPARPRRCVRRGAPSSRAQHLGEHDHTGFGAGIRRDSLRRVRAADPAAGEVHDGAAARHGEPGREGGAARRRPEEIDGHRRTPHVQTSTWSMRPTGPSTPAQFTNPATSPTWLTQMRPGTTTGAAGRPRRSDTRGPRPRCASS